MLKKLFIYPSTFFILILISMAFLPTSVIAAPQIEVISHTNYVDEQGYYNIVGEVQNVGDQAVENVTISAIFYNRNETKISNSFTFAGLDVLFPDKKSPFRILLLDRSTALQIDHYSLDVNFIPNINYTLSIFDKLVIVYNDSHVDDLGYMHIAGSIDNTGELLSYFEVVGTFYDKAGKVVEVGFTNSDESACSLPQTMPFEMIIPPENVGLINTYELVIASAQRNYIVVPEFNSYLVIIVSILMISIILMQFRRKIKNS